MLPAVILAAGESRRMGSPKGVLQLPDGRPFIVGIVDALRSSGEVGQIVVVTGPHHESIARALGPGIDRDLSGLDAADATRIVRNVDPSRGQLSSLWVGMDAVIDRDTPAFLMTLVDVPMIAPSTVHAVVDAWRRTRAPIVRPAMGDRHGHPVLFDRSVFGELREASLESGAKSVVRAHAADLLDVTVSDGGCLVDVDTPEDYERMQTGAPTQ